MMCWCYGMEFGLEFALQFWPGCQIFKSCQIYLFLVTSWNLHLIGSRHVATGTDFSTRFLAGGRGSTELEEKLRSIERSVNVIVNVNVNVNVEETSSHYINIEEISSHWHKYRRN